MTDLTVTHCDAEGGCTTYWRRHPTGLPGSWRTVTRMTMAGVARTAHLCPRHATSRVDGQVGGWTINL